jgi:hypothetical protein
MKISGALKDYHLSKYGHHAFRNVNMQGLKYAFHFQQQRQESGGKISITVLLPMCFVGDKSQFLSGICKHWHSIF